MEGLLARALMLSGGASDLNSDVGPLVERYFRGGAREPRNTCV